MKRGYWLFLLLLCCKSMCGQFLAQRQADTLMQKIVVAREDSLKIVLADNLAHTLLGLESGNFDPLKGVKYLNYKKSPVTGAELFSWSIPLTEGAAYYHVFKFGKAGKDVFVKYLPGDETSVPPYLFYDWVAFKSNRKVYYALLGWSETSKTNRKAVWIAGFTPAGKVNFNHRLMRRGKSRSAFITFEYGKEVAMMLKQDRKGKRIIFDHLAPSDEKYADYFMFYGPDGELNALVLKKGEWWFQDKVKQ